MWNINSITDVITNSSTSVFVVYDESNIKTIKELVNSILEISGEYTFDDLFDIQMIVNEEAIENYFDKDEITQEDIDKYQDIYWNSDDPYLSQPFEGIKVFPKKDISEKAAKLIERIDNIFNIDYTSDW